MGTSYFTMSLNCRDAAILKRIVNIGIDARLEAFVQSSFEWRDNKLICAIGENDFQVLIRRLLEDGTEEAEQLADDIIYVQFGVEVI